MVDTEYFETFADRDWETDFEGEPVRFAMIGLGWWTEEQAIPAVEQSAHCETTVLVSSSREKAQAKMGLAETITDAITYEEFHDGAATDAYDAVYVVTPNALHREYVESAARHGKAILCEKPMTATVEEAERMLETCEEHDATLMIAYRMQTEPAIRRARELVADGTLGEPVFVQSNMSQPLLELVPDPDQWRLDPALAGYGSSVMDLGIYSVNTSRFVLDEDPIAVQATMSASHDAFADVPDERSSFQLHFPDDVVASCTASQNAHLSSHFRVVGTEGELVVEPTYFPWNDREVTLSVDGTTVAVEFEQIDQMTEEFDYFATRLRAGENHHADGEHGLTDMRVLEAIYEAAETGGTVSL